MKDYDFLCGTDFTWVRIALGNDDYHTTRVQAELAKTIDFSGGLRCLDEIIIDRCSKFTQILWPQNAFGIKRLKIGNSTSLECLDLSTLINLEELSIVNCKQLTWISGLGEHLRRVNIQGTNLNTLDISRSKKIKHFIATTHNTNFKINFRNCDFLESAIINVEGYPHISNEIYREKDEVTCGFYNCSQLNTLKIKSENIPTRLDISECPSLQTGIFLLEEDSKINGSLSCTSSDFKAAQIERYVQNNKKNALKMLINPDDIETSIQQNGLYSEKGRSCLVKVQLLMKPGINTNTSRYDKYDVNDLKISALDTINQTIDEEYQSGEFVSTRQDDSLPYVRTHVFADEFPFYSGYSPFTKTDLQNEYNKNYSNFPLIQKVYTSILRKYLKNAHRYVPLQRISFRGHYHQSDNLLIESLNNNDPLLKNGVAINMASTSYALLQHFGTVYYAGNDTNLSWIPAKLKPVSQNQRGLSATYENKQNSLVRLIHNVSGFNKNCPDSQNVRPVYVIQEPALSDLENGTNNLQALKIMGAAENNLQINEMVMQEPTLAGFENDTNSLQALKIQDEIENGLTASQKTGVGAGGEIVAPELSNLDSAHLYLSTLQIHENPNATTVSGKVVKVKAASRGLISNPELIDFENDKTHLSALNIDFPNFNQAVVGDTDNFEHHVVRALVDLKRHDTDDVTDEFAIGFLSDLNERINNSIKDLLDFESVTEIEKASTNPEYLKIEPRLASYTQQETFLLACDIWEDFTAQNEHGEAGVDLNFEHHVVRALVNLKNRDENWLGDDFTASFLDDLKERITHFTKNLSANPDLIGAPKTTVTTDYLKANPELANYEEKTQSLMALDIWEEIDCAYSAVSSRIDATENPDTMNVLCDELAELSYDLTDEEKALLFPAGLDLSTNGEFYEDCLSNESDVESTWRVMGDIRADDYDGFDILSTLERIELTKTLLQALKDQVSDQGLVHLDINPETILVELGSSITVKIIDCMDIPEKSSGNATYYAPEIASNPMSISAKSDVYSLGRVIALIWRVDSEGAVYTDTSRSLLAGIFNNISDVSLEDQITIEYNLSCMLENDPEQRFSIDEAIEAFAALGIYETDSIDNDDWEISASDLDGISPAPELVMSDDMIALMNDFTEEEKALLFPPDRELSVDSKFYDALARISSVPDLEINLKAIDPEDVKQLLQFFDSQSEQGIKDWKKDTVYTFADGSRFTFKNDVFQRDRKDGHDGLRYEMISNKKQLGEGGFGKVRSIKGTLDIDVAQDHTQFYKYGKKGIRRAVKIQEHSDERNPLSNYLEVFEFSKRAAHLGIKSPAIVETSPRSQTSYTVMNEISGRELFDITADDYDGIDILSTAERMELTIALLAALKDQVSDQGLIHRDIKPENILVDLGPPIVVRIIDYDASITAPDGESFGTEGYYAPEIASDPMRTSAKSDVYSMARVIALIWRVDRLTYIEDADCPYTPELYQPERLLAGIFDNITDVSFEDQITVKYTLSRMLETDPDQRFSIDEAIDAFTDLGMNEANTIDNDDWEIAAWESNDIPHSPDPVVEIDEIPGRELRDIIADDYDGIDILSLAERIELTQILLQALKDQVSEQGLVHLDINLETILVELAPPMVATIIYHDMNMEIPEGESSGKAEYYAPEIASNPLNISAKSDVYSLARIIALIWRVDREMYSDAQISRSLLAGIFNNIPDVSLEDQQTITYTLSRMLEKDPQQRFSIDEAIDACAGLGMNEANTPENVDGEMVLYDSNVISIIPESISNNEIAVTHDYIEPEKIIENLSVTESPNQEVFNNNLRFFPSTVHGSRCNYDDSPNKLNKNFENFIHLLDVQ